MIRLFLVLALLVRIAHADNPSLVEARKAIDEIRYDDARRLLVEALKQGGNSPGELAEIYRLSAATAAVLGAVELADKYYRRMLALDPTITLSPDASPRLREPFVAAQAYMAAQPRFDARATRTDSGIEVSIVDPLRMVVGVATVDGGEVRDRIAFESRSVVLAERAEPSSAATVVLLDEHGNFLRLLPVPARAVATPQPVAKRTPILRRWITYAIPAALFSGGSVWFFVDAQRSKGRLEDILANDSMHYFDEAETERRRWRGHTLSGWVSAALGVGFTATAIMIARSQPRGVIVAPAATPDSAGVLLEAKF